jgi:hypothetical protein
MMNDFEVRQSNVRTVDLENGNILRMTRNDPYGLITFSLEHGQLPAHLKDASYTEWSFAEVAAKKYASERQSAEIEIKERIKKKA